MQTRQCIVSRPEELTSALAPLREIRPNLLLVFAAPAFFESAKLVEQLKAEFPDCILAGCSTAGEITPQGVEENRCVVTALRFDATQLQAASTRLKNMADSRAAGSRLAKQLDQTGLKAVMVFGQGLQINGSALIGGMGDVLGHSLPITGGLAGDNGAFARTWVLHGDGADSETLVAIGLSGAQLHFSHGSFGGWQPFGPARKVSRCEGNILFELDGEAALDIYKRYLGEYAKDLPASGLLFPFAMLSEDRNAIGLIRTILGIDEATGSLVLAGEIEPDGYLQLMHASTNSLVDGAEAAARAVTTMQSAAPEAALAILVSCVGRKLVMGDRVDEEVDAVASVLGKNTLLTGFYSYGEISPFAPGLDCKLHNQTMTITVLAEE
jgi:hypothetical protein